MTKKKKNRIEIIDLAKSIAIFMVVLGHTSSNAELLDDPPLFIKVIYSIHMPLFFFLSGLSISPVSNNKWRPFLRKMILTIVVPYLMWSLIFCNFSFENLGYILYGSWKALGMTGTVTSLWYLSCLFFARIIVEIIIKSINNTNRMVYLVPSIVCVIIGVLLPEIEIGYPWNINVAFVAAGFILLGVALRNVIIELAVQKGYHMIGLLIASILLYGITLKLCGDNFGVMMMCKADYGIPLYSLAFALFGGFAVLMLSMILKRMADEWLSGIDLKPITYIGQHTMGVFLLHKPMLQSIILPFFSHVISIDILSRIVASLVSLLISIVLCRSIEYYIPELIGIFSKEKINGDNKEAVY